MSRVAQPNNTATSAAPRNRRWEPPAQLAASVPVTASQGAAVAPLTSNVASPGIEWPPPPTAITTDFCIEGTSTLDEATCYVLPETAPTELLIYLHGILPPTKTSKQKTNFETVLANAGRRGGVAVLIPRGKRGLAPPTNRDWWGWPTSGMAYKQYAPGMIREIAEKRKRLEELVGYTFSRIYVAGSSSGAFFLAALMVHGDMKANAFGILSGGAIPAGTVTQPGEPTPVYFGYGTWDTVGPTMRALADRLRRAGWPVEVKEHPLKHGTHEVYLDEALAFWREQSAKEVPPSIDSGKQESPPEH